MDQLCTGRASDEIFTTSGTVRNFITVVSGLPRSGTSMMMKMLDCGGMPVLTDNLRKPDPDNPKGYYELERVKDLQRDNSWLQEARGKAVKIVSPILQHLKLDNTLKYKIIFMLRDIDEILASQRKMADRLVQGADSIKDHILKQNYTRHLEEIQTWLERKEDVDVMYVNYRDVLSDPLSTATDICKFLDMNLNTRRMAYATDSSLYRQRVDKQEDSGFTVQQDAPENEVIMERLKHLGYL
ncbi:MAG: sulfotransferase [Deferribacteres bacterium]|nr:sulfotransferase [Deferribacteres bacterium]